MSLGAAQLPLDRRLPGETRPDDTYSCAIWPFFVCSLVVLACVASSSSFQHWFVIPVLLCGGIVGWDAMQWWRGRTDLFDPFALLGLVGLHFFFAAPLLHVATGYCLPYVEPPSDWRPWLGRMACLNLAGLLILLFTRVALSGVPVTRPSRIWQLNAKRFYALALVALVGATILQFLVYVKFGGISGYVQAFSESSEEFTGMGLVFLFSESAPIVATMVAICWASKSGHRSVAFLVALFVAFVAMKALYGGLRGSRGHFIYALFWVAMLVHTMIRPLPKRLFVFGLAALLPFMYAYGFYKSFGTEAVTALDAESRADLLDASPRGWPAVLMGDLGRSDVHAFMLYRCSPECLASQYEYANGQTYVGTLALLIPRSILPDRPPPKAKAGTDLLFGPGVYENEIVSTFAFGITGEAILNFGVVGALASFTVIAAVAVVGRRWYLYLSGEDSRRLILPLFLSLTFLTLLWDTDVLLFYTVKEGFVPCLLVALSSYRMPLPLLAEERA